MIAIITDTHAGARNDSPAFDAYFREFFETQFFPRIVREKITTIIHMGDIFDRRKYVNFQTLCSAREYFFDRLVELNLTMYVIAGNHDTYYKNTNDVNSLRLLLGEYIESGHIVLIDSVPESHIIEDTSFVFVPWITDTNRVACMEAIESANSQQICIGHFELDGFQMFQGVRNEGGLNRESLANFGKVFTGHFHTRSHEDNVYYLGSPYEYTWSDFDDPRGFHLFDPRLDILEFVVNPTTMFQKIYYDDTKPLPDVSRFAKKCLKVIVVRKTDYEKFEVFIDSLYQQGVVELNIFEDMAEFAGGTISDEQLNMEDTMSLLEGFVDSAESHDDKNRIKILLKSLYIEAQSIES